VTAEDIVKTGDRLSNLIVSEELQEERFEIEVTLFFGGTLGLAPTDYPRNPHMLDFNHFV
jgi:hypothetical protein